MKLIKSLLFVFAIGGLLSITGCKEKSPLEKVGDGIEKAAEKTGDAAKDAGNAIKDAVDK